MIIYIINYSDNKSNTEPKIPWIRIQPTWIHVFSHIFFFNFQLGILVFSVTHGFRHGWIYFFLQISIADWAYPLPSEVWTDIVHYRNIYLLTSSPKSEFLFLVILLSLYCCGSILYVIYRMFIEKLNNLQGFFIVLKTPNLVTGALINRLSVDQSQFFLMQKENALFQRLPKFQYCYWIYRSIYIKQLGSGLL